MYISKSNRRETCFVWIWKSVVVVNKWREVSSDIYSTAAKSRLTVSGQNSRNNQLMTTCDLRGGAGWYLFHVFFNPEGDDICSLFKMTPTSWYLLSVSYLDSLDLVCCHVDAKPFQGEILLKETMTEVAHLDKSQHCLSCKIMLVADLCWFYIFQDTLSLFKQWVWPCLVKTVIQLKWCTCKLKW